MMLLLSACLTGLAGAEEAAATPTDLSCLHERFKTTIYFYDSPTYTAVNADSHKVSGPAVIVTECLDCGEVLDIDEVDYAEETRPHTFKKGECVLCGFRVKNKSQEKETGDAPGERTIYAKKDDSAEGLLSLTLSAEDLTQMEFEQVQTVVVREEGGDAAVALPVAEVLSQTEMNSADLYLQMAEREDKSLFVGLYLVSEDGREEPKDDGIMLRFYQQTKMNVRVSMAPVDTDELVEAEGEWNDKGYWTVPYLTEGTYFLLP